MDIEVKYLTKEKINMMGAFISYKRSDVSVCEKIISEINEQFFLTDRLIDPSSKEFSISIKEMIKKARCGIIILTDNITPWMIYEIGILDGLKKPIYIYNYNQKEVPSNLKKYKVLSSIDEIRIELNKNKLFTNLLEKETILLKKEDFNKEIIPNLGCVEINLSIKGLKEISDKIKFKFIIPHFFSQDVNPHNETICYKTASSLEECDCECYKNNKVCPYLTEQWIDKHPAFFILNKTYDASVLDDEVRILLPVHKKLGVEFKCFIDVLDFSVTEELIRILNSAGMKDVSISGGSSGERIYFLLNKQNTKGLFVVKSSGGFCNNYICPGIVEK